MTHRNESKLVYGKLVINGETEVDLGRTTMVEMSQRFNVTVKSRIDTDITQCVMLLADTKESLGQIKSTSGKTYEHEGLNPDSPLYGLDKDVIDSIVQIDDETPSPFPGITMNRLMEAQASPEYKAYLIFALHPDKRVGVSGDDIKDCRIEWEQAYPDVATHCPKWVDE